MNQHDWFQMVEQEKPGLLRKVWESYLCSTKREDDQLIARDLTIHARMRGDAVKITVAGWRHYRTNNGLVSFHRHRKLPIDQMSMNGSEPTELPHEDTTLPSTPEISEHTDQQVLAESIKALDKSVRQLHDLILNVHDRLIDLRIGMNNLTNTIDSNAVRWSAP